MGDDDSVNHFEQDYRWLRSADPVRYSDIDAFIRMRKAADPRFDWPDFEARLEAANDKYPNGSRSGDIPIFTNGPSGVLTVNDGDEFNGWHGGATVSESRVPLMFNMGPNIDSEFKNALIEGALRSPQRTRPSGTLRNWDLAKVLAEIYRNLLAE